MRRKLAGDLWSREEEQKKFQSLSMEEGVLNSQMGQW